MTSGLERRLHRRIARRLGEQLGFDRPLRVRYERQHFLHGHRIGGLFDPAPCRTVDRLKVTAFAQLAAE